MTKIRFLILIKTPKWQYSTNNFLNQSIKRNFLTNSFNYANFGTQFVLSCFFFVNINWKQAVLQRKEQLKHKTYFVYSSYVMYFSVPILPAGVTNLAPNVLANEKKIASAQSGNTLPNEDEIATMNHQMIKQKLLEIGETARLNESKAVSNIQINMEIMSIICNDVNDQIALKKQLSILDEQVKKLTQLLEHKGSQVLTEQKSQDKDDVKLGHKSNFGVHATSY
ncbi:hypothetical protein RFI_26708 [Reticulomyxa filosa]|uniref:Uncharacterized protein n=1 Tax=Reticulomyxa filosa TaxID=46433 RepID=X6MB17_RETFI|nr:hypothetical protein RFI_26708 [Reticulomyxa filosa]|eukprot:ETO10667.1 hypothetical protein RFI_26708 [Reticulomyxa filosa]